MQRSRRVVRGRAAALTLLAICGLMSGAKCYPPGTRVVVFVQGIYTSYDASGTQGSLAENHRFETMKAAFLAKGYDPASLLDFSYNGGSVSADGTWHPAAYGCEQTDRLPADNLAFLEQMLKDYRRAHPNAHFTLVGHSLGGYLAFLEAARDAGRPAEQKLGIDVVVTLDAPLKGVDVDKKIILDLLRCDKTYLAGADIVAQKLDPSTPSVRQYQAAVMAQAGVRMATLGNEFDCFYNTSHCVAGGTWVNDVDTQFLEGQASISKRYQIDTPAFVSHDAIVADPNVIANTVAFVGAP
ncbi:MAG: lipase family protein [Chloroflexota bacterium]|nr:lipase family protein [Chloroflexota bacterium]